MAAVTDTHEQTHALEDNDEWLDWETRKDYIPFWKHVIAGKLPSRSYRIGSCAGIMEHCGMFPIDTIKVGSPPLIQDRHMCKPVAIKCQSETSPACFTNKKGCSDSGRAPM